MPDSRRKKRGSSERKASPSDEEKPKGSDARDRSRSRRKDQRDGQKQDSAVAASEASQQEAKVKEDTPSEKRSRSRSREERSANKKKAKSRSRDKEPPKRTTRSSTGRRDKKHSRSASRRQRSRSASRRRRSRSGSRPAQRKSCSASRRRRSRSSSHRKNNRSRSKRRHQSRQRGKKDSRDRSPAQRRRRSSSRDGHRDTKAKGKASDRRRSDDKEEDGSRGREGQRPSSDGHAGRPTQDRQVEASAQLPPGIEQPPPPPPPQQPPPPISGQTTASASSTAPAPQAASQQTGSTQQSSESKQSRDSGQSRPPPKEWTPRPWTRNGSFDSQAGHGGDWHRGGGGGGLSKDVRISKALCKVLRHTAAERGIRLREDGFCDVEDLLKLQEFKSLGCNSLELVEICYGNDKQRFEVKQEPNMLLIRAVQGHSMKEVTDEALLTPISLSDINFPEVCVHGTYRNLAASICNKGLLAGGGTTNRKHIHFAPYEPGDGRIISGMKYNCDIACYVDLRKAILAGIPFFRSTNNVILTPGDHGRLEPQYITKWKDVRTKEEFRGDHFREPAAPGAVPAGSFNGLAPAIAGGGPLAFCPTALAQSSLGGGLATQMVSPHLR